jgi:hypothetical protein
MSLSERPVQCLAIGLTGAIELPDLPQVEPPWTDLAAFGILGQRKAHTRNRKFGPAKFTSKRGGQS